jgi:diguanylate cyclase (GGDEF)-like protein/PAS domain S-box-containing protein
VNARLCEITGYSEEELLAQTWQDMTHPDDVATNVERVDAIATGREQVVQYEKRYLHRSGASVWVRVSSSIVRDSEGQPLHFVAHVEDISDRRLAEDRLKDLADHDSLTGLLNRRRFDEDLRATILRMRRHGGTAALVLVDVDRFKEVNDTFGHKVGDDVLVSVAGALRGRLRATDIVGRLGGDEFAAILFEVEPAGAAQVADELAAAIRSRQVVTPTGQVGVTASIGVVLLDGAALISEDEALIAADRALYTAKSDGRDRVVIAG